MTGPDPLVALLTGNLVGLDAQVRRSIPLLRFLPSWSSEQFDSAARVVAGVVRKAVDEVVDEITCVLEREYAEKLDGQDDVA